MIARRSNIVFLCLIMLTLIVGCEKDVAPPFKIQLVGGLGQLIQPVQGDMNGDGKPDLVAMSYSGTNHYATIFVNKSSPGTLNYPSSFRRINILTGNYNHTSIADIDGDGKQDVILSNAGVFSVLRQNNSYDSLVKKSFDAPVLFKGSSNGVLMIADIDNDHKPDFITWNYSNALTIIKNQGNPGSFNQSSFGNSLNITLDDDTQGVELADLNSDGLPEIIVNRGSQLLILINNSKSALLPNSFSIPIAIDIAATDFKVKDMDGDNRAEIVLQRNSNTITIYKNDGSGPVVQAEDFTRTKELTLGSKNVMLSGWAIDNTDNDTFRDVIVGATDTDGLHTIKIFKSRAAAADITVAFAEAPYILTTDFAASSFSIADFDTDGKKDIACMLVSVLFIFRNQNF